MTVDQRSGERAKTLLQGVGIVSVALMLSVIAHKGYTDVSRLARQHSGAQFWVALGKYFIGNLAGGAKKDSSAAP